MLAILDIVLCIIDVLFLNMFIGSFVKVKERHSPLTLSSAYTSLVLISYISSRIESYSALITILNGVAIILYCLFIFEARYEDKVLLGITFYIFLGLMSVLFFTLFSSILSYSVPEILSTTSPLRIFIAFIIKFIVLLLLVLVRSLKTQPFSQLPKHYWYCFMCLFLFSFGSILITFELALINTTPFSYMLLILLILVLLSFNLIIYYLLHKMVLFFSEKSQLDLFLSHQKLVEQHVFDVEKSHQELRKIRHDMKNHYTILEQYLYHFKIDACLTYISQLKKQLNQVPLSYKTGNDIADIIINQKIYSHKDNGIDFNIQAVFPDSINLLATDLCILLSNLLDNGIEELLELPPECRKLNLTIHPHHQQLLISTSNPVHQSPFVDGILKNRLKPNPQEHGYGLLNIAYVVNKYNGFIQYKCEDQVFHLSILLDNL